jgi:signal transduction histidine kinase
MDVRELLVTGAEEYAAFCSGCLYLKLKTSPKGCGASVTNVEDAHLFLLDQEPEDADLRSLSLAARELRNPLSNLMIAADALMRSADETQQEQLARLNRSLHQIHRLVNNMSDAGRSDLLTPSGIHDLNRLFQDIFEKISTQLESTKVQLIYEGLSQSVYGLANEGQLERAVLNIVSNAMKFMPEGGSIHVTLRRVGRDAVLEIADTGVGIPADDVAHVFDRFYRVDKARSRDTGGTGLGLSIVQQIVRLHAGSVTVQSEQGKGTTFTVQLPVK